MNESEHIPPGLCQCGCGQRTKLWAESTRRSQALPKGEYARYLHGHTGRKPRPWKERMWEKADRSGGPDSCWPWKGALTVDGYGRFKLHERNLVAHRLVYEVAVGPIPEGYHIDHLCKNRACVNPAHLEAVTPGVNAWRSDCVSTINAKRTHCQRGHPFDEENTYHPPGGGRECRTCRELHREWARQRQAAA